MQPPKRWPLQHDQPRKQLRCALGKGQTASCRWTDNSGRTSWCPAGGGDELRPSTRQGLAAGGLPGCRTNTPRTAEMQGTDVIPRSLNRFPIRHLSDCSVSSIRYYEVEDESTMHFQIGILVTKSYENAVNGDDGTAELGPQVLSNVGRWCTYKPT